MIKKEIKVYRDLMGANDEWAAKTRDLLREKDIVMLNFIGSPGSGKTALLEKAAVLLKGRLRFAVLEGDLETTHDAERLQSAGITAYQLLTGGACHLSAKLVHHGLRDLPLEALDMVIVENVGNLVCPAEFDIGEHGKMAILSVAEGEDKPVKYPALFREAGAVAVTKTDLLPHLQFNMKQCLDYIRQVNDNIPVFQVSAVNGTGMEEWIKWLVGMKK